MKKSTVINRSYAILQSIAITSMIFYRLSSFHHSTPSFPLLLVFASELILSFLWLLGQAYLWRPFTRKTFPDRLMLREKTDQLPGIDVFICTADPEKEPPLEVMNTVLSAMAMDYPTEKLSVYVSDDGGCALTLYAMREAWEFGRYWLPFCRRFGIKTRCPKLYFSRYDDDFAERGYEEAKDNIKLKYKLLEEHVKKAESNGEILRGSNSKNHPAHVEVIQDESHNSTGSSDAKIPRLVYVCREKKPSVPHHFKAGALNVLLRVSNMISNAPYVLVLDCDMRCNDPSSAKQAMCFHLDPKISPNLAFVQFPQMFHNLSNMYIYDGKLRSVFSVGFVYNSVIEDYLTGFTLHSKGWKSVFYNPPRPAFLGTATTKLNDTLLQGARWNCGVLQVTFSRLCPLVHRLTSRMSLLQRMCYVYLSFQPLYFFPMWCLATIPQLCLLHAIPLYPKASSSLFMVFSYIFVMSQLKHLEEVLSTGDPIRTWWDEQRIWTMKAIVSYTIGTVNAVLKCFGLKEANFVPTNKVADVEQIMFYQKGLFNFQASTIVLVPLVTLNIICFVVGAVRSIVDGSFDAMFGQIFISFYVLAVHYPVIDGMILRKDEGRVPTSVTMLSLAISISVLGFGSLILKS
ncbi:hypothetical protein V6N11_065689 [Hibiscus sabdariffa]|uniref:Cellulose synthase-like protein G2 n=1 Tax=Hibiscus sabdariffa TaxID=183260 RepID=A0ABR2PI68_9ROSI